MNKSEILHTGKIYIQPHISVIEEEFEVGLLVGSIKNEGEGSQGGQGDGGHNEQFGESKSIFGSIWDDEEDDDNSLW